jgi:hypothetical protein
MNKVKPITTNTGLASELIAEGYVHLTEIPGHGICGLNLFLYTIGLCCNLDNTGYEGRYCFPTWHSAVAAINAWDGTGDPPGEWIKFKSTSKGEYSNPNL